MAVIIKISQVEVLAIKNAFIEALKGGGVTDLEDKYPNSIGGACMEAKIENLMNFKCNYLLESGPAAIWYNMHAIGLRR